MVDDDSIRSVQNMLRMLDKPFFQSLWTSSTEEAERRKWTKFRTYMKNVVMQQNKGYTWADSDFSESLPNSQSVKHKENQSDQDENSTKDREDVLQMLGYDPFEYESEEDKPHLYSMLINFLDESTIEDGFKLQAVVEIVAGFNQIDKINQAITSITNDTKKMSSNSGGIKTLVETKKSISSSLVSLAKENGISAKHNTEKSKGAGTLSGIIKTLQEKGIEESEVNSYDINTAKGIKQVADLSNESIIKQLQFDENDYTQMLVEQRDLIQELENKSKSLEEENRLLKKEKFNEKDE